MDPIDTAFGGHNPYVLFLYLQIELTGLEIPMIRDVGTMPVDWS